MAVRYAVEKRESLIGSLIVLTTLCDVITLYNDRNVGSEIILI